VTESEHDPADRTDGVGSVTDGPGSFREWLIVFGVLTLPAGPPFLSRPGLTVSVLAVIAGLQVVSAGVFHLVRAFSQRADDGSSLTMMALLGGEGILLVMIGRGLFSGRHSTQPSGQR
jgi:uncharacterized membrane protein HdeD (DUF308 family)